MPCLKSFMHNSKIFHSWVFSVVLSGTTGAIACDNAEVPYLAKQPTQHLEAHTQALVVSPGSASQLAQQAEADRAAIRSNIDALKASLASTANTDTAARSAIVTQLKAAHDKYVTSVPGAGGALLGATGSPMPSVTPISPARYQALLAKMRAYDMSKPNDVAAWADLKRKELGQ